MATYAMYYHSPVVHAPTSYSLTLISTNSALEPRPQQPPISQQSPMSNFSGTLSAAQRKSVSAGSTASTSKTRTVTEEMNDQEESLLFRLPPELRNEIYGYLLCPDPLHMSEIAARSTDLSTRNPKQMCAPVKLYPSILSTCRRIKEEAEPLLYTSSIFHAHPSLLTSLPHLTSPLKPVYSSRLTSQIRRWQLSLRLDTDPMFTYNQVKNAFSGAEYLEIKVWQAQFQACDYAVLKLFTGIRGVKVARVGGSIDPKLARWLETLFMGEIEEEKIGAVCNCKQPQKVTCRSCGGRVE